jgi:hypothetical protein
MSTSIAIPGNRGRWVRRGGSIILFGAGTPAPGGGVEGEVGGPPVVATQAGVIHPNIDVFAQRALLRMAKSPSFFTRLAASRMLAAVHSGTLRGIYKEDQYVPAMWAKKRGFGWWQILRPDQDAVQWLDVDPRLPQPGDPPSPIGNGPPIIVFRDSVRSNPARLDPALEAAWLRRPGFVRM